MKPKKRMYKKAMTLRVYLNYIFQRYFYGSNYKQDILCGYPYLPKSPFSSSFCSWDTGYFHCYDCDYTQDNGSQEFTEDQQQRIITHIESNHFALIRPTFTMTERIVPRKRITRAERHKHPLKPWHDPDSLFCSPRLKEIIGKEPLK